MSSPAWSMFAPDAGPLLVVLSGPSGVGKDAVLSVLKGRDYPFHYTVTATTRPRREIKAADHQFLSFLNDAAFDRWKNCCLDTIALFSKGRFIHRQGFF